MRDGEIIAIGSELLIGHRPDTNSFFLSEALAQQGIEVQYKSVVGDNLLHIASAMKVAARRSAVIVTTGGLGSTVDDLTREAISLVTGRPLRRRQQALKAIQRKLMSQSRDPTALQLRQALIPTGAEMLNNPVGLAPGFLMDWNRSVLIALPGVSKEAEAMFVRSVVPLLTSRQLSRKTVEKRTLHTFGFTESDVDHQLRKIDLDAYGVQLGLLASPLGVTISLTTRRAWRKSTRASRQPMTTNMLEKARMKVRSLLKDSVYAEQNEKMEEVVGRYLTKQSLTLAVAESCTGGLIGHRLTQVAGSSRYLDRVLVCYSNLAKQELLGVSRRALQKYGAVSEQIAAAMAKGVRQKYNVSLGLSITGIAGPGGGTFKKPVGLVYVGLDSPQGTLTRAFQFHGDRETIKLRASQAALDQLRRWLLDKTA